MMKNPLRMLSISLTKKRNRFAQWRSYSKRELRPSTLPSGLTIETTSCCNLDCAMCPRQKGNRTFSTMPERLFRGIIDETAEFGETAWLHMFGEPLLDPHLLDRIDYVAEKGIVPLISTNATLLHAEKAERLVRSPAGIVILSVDAASAKTYANIRRKGDFDSTVRNILHFLSLLKERRSNARPSVILQLIRMHETQDEVKEFTRRWKHFPVRVWVKPFVSWRGNADDIKVSLPQNSTGACSPAALCDWPWRRLAVQADGHVVPCCYCYSQEVVLGNASNSGIREIWQGGAFAAFREKLLHDRSSVPLCRDCQYSPFGFFGWAFYSAFGQYGVDRVKLLHSL